MSTIVKHYNITQQDIDNLEELASGCDVYWKKAEKFFHDVMLKSVDDLTEAQRAWLEDILERVQK